MCVVGWICVFLPGPCHNLAIQLSSRIKIIFHYVLQISDRSLNFPECLRVSNGQKPLVSEFHSTALPGLASLAPYHSYLEPQTQQRIVRCLLKYGMGEH